MAHARRIAGGRRVLSWSLPLAALGLAGFIVGLFLSPQRALTAWLVNYFAAAGIVVGLLTFLTFIHSMNAVWPTVVRRVAELACAASPLLLVAYVPLAAGSGVLYPWTRPESLSERVRGLVEHKALYLNEPFWVLRALLYLTSWVAIGWLLRRWSVRQDDDADVKYTLWQRRLSAAAIPVVFLTSTFAAIDWVMSLRPDWFSSVYGFYVWAGGSQAAIALIVIVTRALERAGLLRSLVSPKHYLSLGKLLLTFTILWAYMAFAQYLIIWIAGLPHEETWFVVRSSGGWAAMSIAVVVARFALPFAMLLSRDLKLSGGRLAAVSGLVLAAHWLDCWWLVVPELGGGSPGFGYSDVAAFLLVFGAGVSFAVWRARGVRALPVQDPNLDSSLRYAGS